MAKKISFGNLEITKVFLGSNEVSKLFLGSLEIYNSESGPVITDLTGTKWVINKIPNLPSPAEDYDIIFSTYDNGQFYSRSGISLGASGVLSGYEIIYNWNINDFTAYNSDNGWVDSKYRIIEITGGTDVTNSTLISWLMNNATQVPVVDLSNTKWEINCNNWSTPPLSNEYYINGEITNYGSFSSLTINTNSSPLLTNISFNNDYNLVNEGHIVYNSVPCEITITNGIDTTNPDLIAWLSQNATLIPSSSYSVTVNITNGTASGFPANYNPNLDCYGLIRPNTGYYISGISVSNASHYLVPQFMGDNAIDLFLENATGNIQVNVTCSLISGANSYSITSTDANATPDINVIYENGYQELIVEGLGRDYDLDYNGITNATLEFINEITDENGNTIALELLISNPTGNVVIDVTATEIEPEEEPTTIEFTIGGITYTAEESMTWYEWCQSDYNTSGWMCGDDSSNVRDNGGTYIVRYSGTNVVGSDNIIESGSYTVLNDGGSIK